MPTNVYFNNYGQTSEQRLLEDLIIEAIRMYGHNTYYLPRASANPDQLYTQSDWVSYNEAHMIEMYVESFDGAGFNAESNFLTKFGIEIRNQITFSCARRVFQDTVNVESEFDLVRPREGDLIFFPLNNRCFKIMYVDKFQMFYQLGALQTWKMTCELFEYSSERFDTGIAAIDALEQYSDDLTQWAVLDEDGIPMLDEDGNYMVTEKYDQDVIDPLNDAFVLQDEADEFIDFTEIDPFSEGEF